MMEFAIRLHQRHATTIEVGGDRWPSTGIRSMGPAARLAAAWTEKLGTGPLELWLDGCLPENGLRGRYQARARAILHSA